MKNRIESIFNLIKGSLHHGNSNSGNSSLMPEQIHILDLFGIKVSENSTGSCSCDDMSPEEATRVLASLASGNCMNEETVIDFDKKVFSLKYISNPEATPGRIDINSIPALFCENKNYMDILKARERVHSPERARLKVHFDNCKENESNIDSAIGDMSSSFSKIADESKNHKYLCIVWIKYLNLVSNYTHIIPDALLNYITVDTYKSLFCIMKGYFEKEYPYADENIDRNRLCQVKTICRYILENIDKEDIPSLMLLGKCFQKEGNYKQAEKCFELLIKSENCFNAITALADCYSKEISSLKQQTYKSKDMKAVWGEIDKINDSLEKLYQGHLSVLSHKIGTSEDGGDAKKNYVILSCMYARFLKGIGNFEFCYQILDRIPTNYPEYHRVLLERGFLCQHQGKGRWTNRYYNLKNAVELFKKAADQIDQEDVPRHIKKSALVPLANTLFMLENYEDAKKVCTETFLIDPKEHNIHVLMEQISNAERNMIPA